MRQVARAKALFAAVGLALATGCASPPPETVRADEPWIEVSRGVLHVVTRGGEFTSEDRVHWFRTESFGEVDLGYRPAPDGTGTRADEAAYRVTRDLDSDSSARARWHVWEREGISWRILATLPDDAAPGE